MEKKTADRRVQRTRRMLQEALVELILEKGYEKITVQDIIDSADVGRSTFYSHFVDKEDLFLSGFEAMKTTFEEHIGDSAATSQSPWEVIEKMFEHARSHQHVYKTLAGKQGGRIAMSHLEDYLTQVMSGHLRPAVSSAEDAIPSEVVARFAVGAFMSMLTWWLDNDLPCTARRAADMYRQLAGPGLSAIMHETQGA